MEDQICFGAESSDDGDNRSSIVKLIGHRLQRRARDSEILRNRSTAARARGVVAALCLIGTCFGVAQAQVVTINSVADLQNIQNNLAGNYVLGGNINATGYNFTPIGENAAFVGSVNGNNYTITGLSINSSSSFVGLFGQIGNAGVVQNVGLSGVTINGTGTSASVGSMAGLNYGTVINSYSTGTVIGSGEFASVGGLVGQNYYGASITHSNAAATVNDNGSVSSNCSCMESAVGGLVGSNYGTVNKSYSTGSVRSGISSVIGGLAGYNEGPISESYATGAVNGSGAASAIGGLIGVTNSSLSVTDSYSTGAASGSGNNSWVGGLMGVNFGAINNVFATGGVAYTGSGGFAGGLVGRNSSNGTISNGYWDTTVTGQAIGVGTGGVSGTTGLTTAQLQSGTLPGGFDPSVWSATVGRYPTLISNSPPVTPISLVDPLPLYVNGAAIMSNERSLGDLASATQTVGGVAADGVAAVVIRISGAKLSGKVTLTLSDENGPTTDSSGAGYLTALPDNGSNSGATGGVITVSAVSTGSGAETAFAVYHAPIDFVRLGNISDPNLATRMVSIQEVDSGGTTTQNIQIARPPVALIHGIWDSAKAWNFFLPFFSGATSDGTPQSFQIYPVDYESTNGDGVIDNAKISLQQLQTSLSDFKTSQRIAAVQFDVVAHSMGGLITRALPLVQNYLASSNYNKGIVHKLITIDTPHDGSQFAKRLEQLPTIVAFLCDSLLQLSGHKVGQAVVDMVPNSSLLAQINNLSALHGIRTAVHSIEGAASPLQALPAELLLANLSPDVCTGLLPPGVSSLGGGFAAVFGGLPSDLIVSVASQGGTRSIDSPTSITAPAPGGTIHALVPLLFPIGPDALNKQYSVSLKVESAGGPNPGEVIKFLNIPVNSSGGEYAAVPH